MITYRVAQSATDFKNAATLVHTAYMQEGYISEQKPSGISSFLNRPGAATIVAIEDNTVRGTISIVKDSDRGLPMDCTYKEQVDGLRTDGRHLAEICQFATDQNQQSDLPARNTSLVTLGLFAHIVQIGLADSTISDLCFTVNKKHEGFYRAIGCTTIGPQTNYARANGAVSQGFFLHLASLQKQKETNPFIGKILTYPVNKEITDPTLLN
ncbi:MAG: hypothetical protein KC877_02475 [Candidatus Kaiserbacteria bacterium]|nr:hypothetical protein [Candidatus Kaiserbacteria bacterium]MCB9816453.1 hypothetical protein [Candidatus Nomurabacteria bacterium]